MSKNIYNTPSQKFSKNLCYDVPRCSIQTQKKHHHSTLKKFINNRVASIHLCIRIHEKNNISR